MALGSVTVPRQRACGCLIPEIYLARIQLCWVVIADVVDQWRGRLLLCIAYCECMDPKRIGYALICRTAETWGSSCDVP